jgi:hypothetical protein
MSYEYRSNSFRASVLGGEKRKLVVTEKNPRQEGSGDLSGSVVPRSEVRRGDHRDADRHRLIDQRATVTFEGKRHAVEVVNLSGGGAMIRCSLEPRLWDIIELELGEGYSLECAVRWLREGSIGLEFAHETKLDCAPEERAAVLLEVIQHSFPEQEVHLERPEPVQYRDQDLDEEVADLGERDGRRHPLIWTGQIHSRVGSHPTRLRNVSAGGALADVEAYYPVGSEVMLDLGGAGKFIANVRWVCGGKVGLGFREEFDLNCLANAKPEVASNQWLKPDFLDQEIEDDSTPWHIKWKRSSIEQIRQDLEGFLKR